MALPAPDGETILRGTATGTGPPVLLLHAGGERREVWTPVADLLAAAGYTAIAYDLRGHGDTDAGPADTLDSLARDVAAMIEATSGRPVVVGASIGGLAALLALGEHTRGDLVAGLVLVDVVPDPPSEQTRAWLASSTAGLAEHPLVSDVFTRIPALRRAAAALTRPTLLVRGGPSSPVSDADVERFRSLTPRVDVVRIESAGHLIARDAPAELAKVLLDWLGR